MKPDDFEQRLQHLAPREIPAGWRAEILATARTAAGSRRSHPATRPSTWWRELFWPSPWAWAGAASVWVLIFALDFAASSGTDIASRPGYRPIPDSVIQMAMAERQRLMTSLMDTAPVDPAIPPREAIRPRPRSERASGFSCA